MRNLPAHAQSRPGVPWRQRWILTLSRRRPQRAYGSLPSTRSIAQVAKLTVSADDPNQPRESAEKATDRLNNCSTPIPRARSALGARPKPGAAEAVRSREICGAGFGTNWDHHRAGFERLKGQGTVIVAVGFGVVAAVVVAGAEPTYVGVRESAVRVVGMLEAGALAQPAAAVPVLPVVRRVYGAVRLAHACDEPQPARYGGLHLWPRRASVRHQPRPRSVCCLTG